MPAKFCLLLKANPDKSFYPIAGIVVAVVKMGHEMTPALLQGDVHRI